MSNFKFNFLSNIPKSSLPIVLLKKISVPNSTLSKLSDNEHSKKFLLNDVKNNSNKNNKQTGSVKINEDDNVIVEDSAEDIVSICYNSQSADPVEVPKSAEESSFSRIDDNYDCPSTSDVTLAAEPVAESSSNTCLVKEKLNLSPSYSPSVQLIRISPRNAVDSSALAVRSKHRELEAASLDCNSQAQEDGDDNRELCEYCSKSFDSTELLQKHIKNNHKRGNGRRKLKKCPHCSYTSSSHLKRHIARHTHNYPFNCAHCTYGTVSKERLRFHMSVHTGERVYKCDLCKFTSISLKDLLVHTRTHIGEHPYKCPHCQFSCSAVGILQRHTRIHLELPHKCCYCQYSFANTANLYRHIRTHTGDRPHKCSQCNYSSSISSNLMRHLRTHAGERRHKCLECSKAFSTLHNLKRHSSVHIMERARNRLNQQELINSSNTNPSDDTTMESTDPGKSDDSVADVPNQKQGTKTTASTIINEPMEEVGNQIQEIETTTPSTIINEIGSKKQEIKTTASMIINQPMEEVGNQKQEEETTTPSTIINKIGSQKQEMKTMTASMIINQPTKEIIDTSQPYVCYDCNKSFKQKIFLEQHWKCHHYLHFQKIKNYKCPKCEEISTCYGFFIRHLKFAHRLESSKD
ncbi:oocyte zinc finger protein XlCOF28-like [Microplitis mediator]|uniref:oocyte zinc finger protein XlCOF28-like n=1 Tax=Microplitis mediator TaxID=375433 RepID=UPI002554376B|nr:oocyte zinc finger protein XlCOF28-like [Microplitis mediator]